MEAAMMSSSPPSAAITKPRSVRDEMLRPRTPLAAGYIKHSDHWARSGRLARSGHGRGRRLTRAEADRGDHAPRRMIRRSGVIAILNQSSRAGRPWRAGVFVASAGTGGLVPLAGWRGGAGVEVVSGIAFLSQVGT